MRTNLEQQLKSLEQKRLALEKKMAEHKAKSVSLTGMEPELHEAIVGFKASMAKMNLPASKVLEGLVKVMIDPEAIATFRIPRGPRSPDAKKPGRKPAKAK